MSIVVIKETGKLIIKGVGVQGIQGEQGIQGIQGIQGEQGEQGIQGIQGEQSLEVYETFSNLPITGTLLISYKVTNDSTSSNNGYYHWNGVIYIKDADLVITEIDTTEVQIAVDSFAVSNFVFRENLFIYNRFNQILGGDITSYPPLNTGFAFGSFILNKTYLDALPIFGYIGQYAKLSFSTVSNGGITILKSEFDSLESYNGSIGANWEINTPVPVSGTIKFYQITGGSEVLKGGSVAFSFSAGINIFELPPTTFDATFDAVFIRWFPSAGDWDNQDVDFGRLMLYSGIEDTSKRLDEYINEDGYKYYSNKIQTKENLFIHNKYLENLAEPDTTGEPSTTSFNFGFSILNQTFEDALPIFGYIGNCAVLDFSTVSNGGIIILKSDYHLLNSYNDSLIANWEFYSPVPVSGTFRVYQGISGVFTQKGSNISFSFDAGISILNIPLINFDTSYDSVYLRFFPNATDWDNQTIKFGRLMLSSEIINGRELEVSIQEIYKNLFDTSDLVKEIRTDLDKFSLSHWYGKQMVVLGASITSQNLWQPEVIRSIGLANINRAVGGSMITPYITGLTGQTTGESIYFRADAIDTDNPDLILLFGGQNDSLTSMSGDIPLGAITDAVYTGAEVSSNPPSFYASYMGTVEKLLTQNSSALLILITPLWSGDQSYAIKKTKTDAIKEIGVLYGLRVINLLEDVGINSINQTTYLTDTVHPNAAGGLLIGYLIANYLK